MRLLPWSTRWLCVSCSQTFFDFGLRNSRFQKFYGGGAVSLYLAIVVIGSIPGARHDIAEYGSELVLHSTAYAVLGALIFLGSRGDASRRAIWAVTTVAVMGALDEYVQSFWPFRTAALGDWLVNFASGVVISAVLWGFWRMAPVEPCCPAPSGC